MKDMRERGQVTVLVLGLGMLAFAVSGLAVDGTRAFLFRRTLQSAADAAAIAGTSELDRSLYYGSGGRVRSLDAESARSATYRWIALRGIGSRAQVTVSSQQVRVVMRDEVPTMFLGLVGVGSIPVGVEAVAEPRAG